MKKVSILIMALLIGMSSKVKALEVWPYNFESYVNDSGLSKADFFKTSNATFVEGKEYKLSDYVKYNDIKDLPYYDLGFPECGLTISVYNDISGIVETYKGTFNLQRVSGNNILDAYRVTPTKLDKSHLDKATFSFINGAAEKCSGRYNAINIQYGFTHDKMTYNIVVDENYSDGSISIPKKVYNNIKVSCSEISLSDLEQISALTLTSTISSGIGAAGSTTSAITSGLERKESKKVNGGKSKGLNLAATISSAVGAAGATTSAVTSGTANAKVKKVIEAVKKCKEALNQI